MKKRIIALVTSACLLLCFLAGCGTKASENSGYDSAEELIDAFFEALQKGDVDAIYDMSLAPLLTDAYAENYDEWRLTWDSETLEFVPTLEERYGVSLDTADGFRTMERKEFDGNFYYDDDGYASGAYADYLGTIKSWTSTDYEEYFNINIDPIDDVLDELVYDGDPDTVISIWQSMQKLAAYYFDVQYDYTDNEGEVEEDEVDNFGIIVMQLSSGRYYLYLY